MERVERDSEEWKTGCEREGLAVCLGVLCQFIRVETPHTTTATGRATYSHHRLPLLPHLHYRLTKNLPPDEEGKHQDVKCRVNPVGLP